MQINYSKRIFGLDLMRAIAILFVIFSHVQWIIPEVRGVLIELLSVLGVMGVEIFFVLSGFLIGRIMYTFFCKDDFGFKDVFYFWVRRWFRTLPNYYLILLLNIFIAIYLGIKLPENLWGYFFFIHNFAWEMPSFFTESWSLPVEEFAYILGPLILYLFLFFKLKTNKSTLFGVMTVCIILFFFLTKIVYTSNHSDSNMIFWNVNLKAVTWYRIDAIYYGVFAAYISLVKPTWWVRYKNILLVTGMSVFIALNVAITLKGLFIESHPFFWNVLYLPINSVAIMLSLPYFSNLKQAPSLFLKPITYISLISYAMYLLHYSVILQLMKYFMPSDNLPRFDTAVYIVVYLSITIFISYLFYRIYEKPMMDIRDSQCIKRKFNK